MIRADWLLVLLTLLAVTRLTRLVTEDVVSQPVRGWIVRHRPTPEPPLDEDWFVYLVHCRWCASMWITFPVAAVVYNWPTAWPVQVGLLALAGSLVAGLAAGLER